jgi:hypothetical protein
MQTLHRSILFAAAAMIYPLCGQDPNPNTAPQFEVAIIKPTVDKTIPGLIVHLPGESGYRGVNMVPPPPAEAMDSTMAALGREHTRYCCCCRPPGPVAAPAAPSAGRCGVVVPPCS